MSRRFLQTIELEIIIKNEKNRKQADGYRLNIVELFLNIRLRYSGILNRR